MVHCLLACLTIKPWPLWQVAGSLDTSSAAMSSFTVTQLSSGREKRKRNRRSTPDYMSKVTEHITLHAALYSTRSRLDVSKKPPFAIGQLDQRTALRDQIPAPASLSPSCRP